MTKISKLTKEQIDRFPEFVARGIEIGLDTNPNFDLELIKQLIQAHRTEICNLSPAIHFLVYDSPFTAIKAIPSLSTSNALYGQHDISWLIYYKFYQEVLGLTEETKQINYLYELSKHVGWVWFGKDVVVITKKPNEIHLANKANGLKVLHNLNDYALKYLDGTGVYSLNGLRIPSSLSWIITTPAEEIRLEDIFKISNTEIRTEAIKKVGIEKAFSKLDKTLLDKESVNPGGNYQLYKVNLNSQIRIYLTGFCPSSGKLFFEAVHPDCKTVKQALNWREHGIISEDYTIPKFRT